LLQATFPDSKRQEVLICGRGGAIISNRGRAFAQTVQHIPLRLRGMVRAFLMPP
jgi:hypothetical protein